MNGCTVATAYLGGLFLLAGAGPLGAGIAAATSGAGYNLLIGGAVTMAVGASLLGTALFSQILKNRQEEIEKEGTRETVQAHGQMNGSGGNTSIFDWHL